VVVLDEDAVGQVEAVVGAATDPDGVLLQCPQAGRRLARIDHPRGGARDGGDVAGGDAGDPTEALEQVERDAFGAQQAAGRAGEVGDDDPRRHGGALGDQRRHRHRRIDRGEDGPGDRQAGQDALAFDQQVGPRRPAGPDDRLGRDIAPGQVLGQCHLDDATDLGNRQDEFRVPSSEFRVPSAGS
jgi:hypothetical protein